MTRPRRRPTEQEQAFDQVRRSADSLVRCLGTHRGPRLERILENARRQAHEHANGAYSFALMNLKTIPVTIEEFVDSPEFYAGQYEELWPEARRRLIELNPDIMAGDTPVHEYYDGGAIGCHAAGTEVLLYSGRTKRVEHVRIGDVLMGPDSKPRTVLRTVRGREEMRRIVPNKSAAFEVNASHILSLKRTNKGPHWRNGAPDTRAGEIVNVTVREYEGWPKSKRALYKLRRVAVDYRPADPLPMDPYILGVWLGDGTTVRADLTNVDPEVTDAWTAYWQERGVAVTTVGHGGITHATRAAGGSRINHAAGEFRGLGVLGRKHIPLAYLTASRADRLALLAGLIDSDGTLSCNGYSVTQTPGQLSNDIAMLARSLGYRVSTGVQVAMGETYDRHFISGPVDAIPVRIPRKRAQPSRSNRAHDVEGFTVEPLPEGDYYGFSLDGDHLYVTAADFLVHHNTAKTFVAMTSQQYQLYVLSCFKSPQRLFRLPAATPLVFMMLSVSERVTRRVLYEPFRNTFLSMPYIKANVKHDRYKENALYLDGNIQVIPALSSVQNMVGQAIVSAVMDEANFMQVVMNSVQAVGMPGGMYDQADVTHRTLVRRRRSRFITAGPSPGCISVMSSVRYKNDFLARKIEEAKANPNPTRRWYQSKQYEVQPADKYVLPRFRVLVGTDAYPSRVLTDADVAGAQYPENAEVLEVPGEFREDFLFDPDSALRDVCGIASSSIRPYITQRNKVVDAIVRWRESTNGRSWVQNRNVRLMYEGMPQIVPENLPTDKDTARYVHIDLSKTKDRCGISITKVSRFVDVQRDGHVEHLPYFCVEEAISIEPSPSHELDIAEVRNWVMALKTFYGFNIAGVTYDGFQSAESVQAWRRAGIWSEVISMDRDTEAYDVLKGALYDNRVDLPDNDVLQQELAQLELHAATGIIDHPPRGSKDVSDAVAGSCKGASIAREVRSQVAITTTDGQSVSRQGRRTTNVRPRSNLRR